MIDLMKYLGLRWGEPYNCFTLVKAIRADMGLETPVLYEPNVMSAPRQILEHKFSDLWVERPKPHIGLPGDIILMSRSKGTPAHHIGVVINADSIVHLDLGHTVSLLPIGRINLIYPGEISRWGNAPWENKSNDLPVMPPDGNVETSQCDRQDQELQLQS